MYVCCLLTAGTKKHNILVTNNYELFASAQSDQSLHCVLNG